MKIDISKKQYETLVKSLETASWVYGALSDEVDEKYQVETDEIEVLRDELLEMASEFGCADMAEDFKGHVILSDKWSDRMDEVLETYDDYSLWHELEIRLGQRDFARTVSEKEKIEMRAGHGWYPERIHKLYEKWGREFEEYGVDRLTIDENLSDAPSVDDLHNEIKNPGGFRVKIR